MGVYIVGGGIAGCSMALALAKEGKHVTILEKLPALLAGSSDATPCRLGLGFHYMDEETSQKCLETTIAVIKQFPGYKLSDTNPAAHLSKGRYYVVQKALNSSIIEPFKRALGGSLEDADTVAKQAASDSYSEYTPNSFKSIEEIEVLYTKLQSRYQTLIDEDPTNEVFGPPDQFFRRLRPEEISSNINDKCLQGGFETAECTLDWPRLKQHFLEEIQKARIEVKTNAEVLQVTQSEHTDAVSILFRQNQAEETVKADLVINASWYHIEALNHQMNFPSEPGEIRTNRTKVIIRVKLPEALLKEPSGLFCFGPHCSFTNLGDGTAFVSYEPVTNIELNTGLQLTPFSFRLVNGGATQAEKEKFAAAILQGVSDYIPALKGAVFLATQFGIVKSKGEVDIYSANSAFHSRLESGVNEQQVGWIDVASVKLLQFASITVKAMKLVHKHESLMQFLQKTRTFIQNRLKNVLSEPNARGLLNTLQKILKRTLIHERNLDSSLAQNQILRVLDQKLKLRLQLLDIFQKQRAHPLSKSLPSETDATLSAAEIPSVMSDQALVKYQGGPAYLEEDLFLNKNEESGPLLCWNIEPPEEGLSQSSSSPISISRAYPSDSSCASTEGPSSFSVSPNPIVSPPGWGKGNQMVWGGMLHCNFLPHAPDRIEDLDESLTPFTASPESVSSNAKTTPFLYEPLDHSSVSSSRASPNSIQAGSIASGEDKIPLVFTKLGAVVEEILLPESVQQDLSLAGPCSYSSEQELNPRKRPSSALDFFESMSQAVTPEFERCVSSPPAGTYYSFSGASSPEGSVRNIRQKTSATPFK